ncbi:YjbH domain-containing protein [Antarcticibacterium sp. 1MA-6-2]|uniref:YjbH domain-containing protein n=1 Tax=Antarcticibacterium sp. 1MA-6-2 TaxID=2908210 RepID=UPI001F324AF3|nr:YjbH domain-containing protein [Antarcticibacterium sp. 1MA-6-2]UJH89858.1 YjbH domain-containing protein [Antarcticibacterium sp. 1MA-6-2]
MRKHWISFCLACFCCAVQAQDIEKKLFEAGFENVQVKQEKDTTKVYFEHREFRSPFHSMRYANLLLQEEQKELIFVPLHHSRPIGNYTADTFEFSALSKEDRRFFRDEISGYRFHFRIHPDLSARFGYYSSPFQVKFNVVLDSRIYLAPGLSVQTGISIPVENSLDAQDMKPRLAPSMLHYFIQPVNSHFVALSVGTFYYDTYGIDFQYRYAPLDGQWSFGLEAGYTGFYWLNADGFYSEDLEDLHLVTDVEFRPNFQNLSFKLSGGQFMFGDRGIRADMIKQFGTVDVGLHGGWSDLGTTAGFQIAFPLFPGKIYRNRHLEIRTTEEFRWEYNYNNEEPVTRSYRIGMPRISDVLRQYNSNLMKNLD